MANSRLRSYRFVPLAPLMGLALLQAPASATEFSVSPVRVELKSGMLNETITVTNHAKEPLRVLVKLSAWTQDESGADVYQDTADLVYFPRQMDIEPDGKRLIRVGARSQAGTAERAYRLFIEEQPDAAKPTGRAAVSLAFRFGVPVFLPPAAPRIEAEVTDPKVEGGRLSITVHNAGNRHFRLDRVAVADTAGWRQEIAGWYSLPGSRRTYSAVLPPEVCRRGGTFAVTVEGDGVKVDRQVNVTSASCQ